MTSKLTESVFLREIAEHGIKIVRDDDIHRHIVFKNPDNSNCWFELVTWPGHLCISGDCGTYVFSRINDMFEFFRMDKNDFNYRKDASLNINPIYWGEKLQAVDRCSGFMEFDEDSFKARVKEHFDGFVESHPDLNIDHKNELWAQIQDDVLVYSDNEHEAYSVVNNFDYYIGDHVFQFTDFFDGGATETYASRYLWCLYAIVWGIRQYDLTKQS